jgi:CheY-like chemotaxis protein/HPt (histidine-containing phosphotransfer) domain-containing protein
VNRHVVDEQIKQCSMRSTAVASGAEALRALKEAYVAGDPFQFGLLDFNVPEMDGEALARAIKSDRALADTVLLLLTSAGQRGDAKRMTKAGFAGYLTKPIRASLLMDALATAWASWTLAKDVPLITRHLLAERRVSAATEPLAETEAIQARVLVVEDNPVNQRLVRLTLERMGCRVDPAANGKEAVEMARNLPYDIVFMDCQMPEMDGYQATREIRSRETGARHLPIVALTAGAMEGDREKALQAGMDDYLTKPVQREDLRRALGRWLRPLPAATPPVAPPASDRAAPEDLDAFLETLKDLREGIGEEGVAATLPGFFRRTAETIALLRQAVTSNDVSEVRRLTHDLKGSCGTFGAKSMAKISVELEAEAELGSVANAIALVDSLQRLCVHLEDAFAKYRGTAPTA